MEEKYMKLKTNIGVEVVDVLGIKVINKSSNPLPKYETVGSAGMDLMANLSNDTLITLEPGKRTIVPTGLFCEIPSGYAVDVRPRSGLAIKHGITVLNTPGLVDEDYRGEIGVILINHGDSPFVVKNGDKIAQMTISKVYKLPWIQVEELTVTDRGENGFGSTSKTVCDCSVDCGPACKCK